MDETIRNTARNIVDTLTPVDDEDDEIDAQNADFMANAIPLLRKALDDWKATHGPDEHCDIRVVTDDDGKLCVKVTPMTQNCD